MASLDDLARAPNVARHIRDGWERWDARARAAWLLAVEVASMTAIDARFVRVFETTGKVGRGSDRNTAVARKLACYLAVVVADCGIRRVAAAAGLNAKTVTLHVAEVEDWRECAEWDAAIDFASRELVGMAAQVVFGALAMPGAGEVAA